MKHFRLTGMIAILVSSGAFFLALFVSAVIIALFGESPLEAVAALFDGVFRNRVSMGAAMTKVIPLLLVALGWIIAFSAGRFNIGFEGQVIMGGIAATSVGISLGTLPTAIHLPLAVVAGVGAGAFWVGIAAWLWARRGVNEIISTLLLNFVAIQILAWLVEGPLQRPDQAIPQSSPIAASALWPTLLQGTPVSWDLLLAFSLVGLIALLPRTSFGFNVRMTGLNEAAARHAGIATKRVAVTALIMSGALGGLGGSSLLLGGEINSLFNGFSANFGFIGIVVALLARNNALACLPAAILLAFLIQGGGFLQADMGIPSALVVVTQGLVIIFVAASDYIVRRIRLAPIDERLKPASKLSASGRTGK